MAQLPSCPNHREGRCDRSEIVLAGESEFVWKLICRCCHLTWVLTKPKVKEKGKYDAAIDRLEKATQADREKSRIRTFGPPRGGWTANV